METSNNRIITARLSTEDIQYLSELSVIRGITRSEVIREMITAMRSDSSVTEDTIFTMRYTASLLTALLRKMSAGNPDEAESMIKTARLKARKEVEL